MNPRTGRRQARELVGEQTAREMLKVNENIDI
jgi:hypothetical protein